jgi:hypothetical protein
LRSPGRIRGTGSFVFSGGRPLAGCSAVAGGAPEAAAGFGASIVSPQIGHGPRTPAIAAGTVSAAWHFEQRNGMTSELIDGQGGRSISPIASRRQRPRRFVRGGFRKTPSRPAPSAPNLLSRFSGRRYFHRHPDLRTKKTTVAKKILAKRPEELRSPK